MANPLDKFFAGDSALEDQLERYGRAIAATESGGQADPYRALGPVIPKSGDRAYGKHQVMGANIPKWTEEILGRAYTPQEFLNDPKAQDRVFKGKFGQYLREHGNPHDAASMWFTGKPYAEGYSLKDPLGTSGTEYVNRFVSNLRGQPGGDRITVYPKGKGPTLDEWAAQNMPAAPRYAPGASPQDMLRAAQNSFPTQNSGATWNAGLQFGNNALVGAGIPLMAGASAAQDVMPMLTQASPRPKSYQELWQESRAVRDQFGKSYDYAKIAYDNAAREWRDSNPGSAFTAGFAGEMVPATAGAVAAPAAITGGATALASRGVPYARSIGNFLGGTAGEASKGIAKFLIRVPSMAASGAVQGTGAAAATAPLHPDMPFDAQLGWGAATGAVLNPVVAPAINALTSPLRAMAKRPVAENARDLADLGVHVPGSQLITQSGAQRMTGLLTKPQAEPAAELTHAIAKQFGADRTIERLGAPGLTKQVLEERKKEIVQAMGLWADAVGVKVDPTMRNAVIATQNAARTKLKHIDDGAWKEVNALGNQILQRSRERFYKLSGADFRGFTDSASVLATMKADPRKAEFARKLETILFDALERSDAGAKAAIKELQHDYRVGLKLENAVERSGPTGVLDPRMVTSALKDERAGTPLRKLAEGAQFLAKPTPGGTAKPFAYHGGNAASMAGGAGAGIFLGEHLGQIAHQFAERPGLALLGGAGAALGYGAKKRYGNYLESPEYTRRVIENTLNPRSHYVVDPLLPVAGIGARQ